MSIDIFASRSARLFCSLQGAHAAAGSKQRAGRRQAWREVLTMLQAMSS
jgi:hypothetical protein